jgi:predicted signal transduction protein with EAL and GGDEF domain
MSTSVNIEAEAPAPDWITRFVDDIPTGVALFDRELRYVTANAGWVKAFRLSAAPLAGQRHDELDPTGGSQFAALQARAIAGEVVSGCDSVETDAAGRLWQRAVSFRPRRARDGSVLGVTAALQEVVTAPSANIAQPMPDRLTGIAGREAFLARLRAALKPVGGDPRATAMFLLDIDDFKGINDLYGTRIGDRVLKTVAARLLTGIRSRPTPPGHSDRPVKSLGADLVARLGADEFGVILGNATPTPADAEAFARRLLQLVATPINVGDQRIRLTANLGYIITTPGHHTEDDVLRDLNVALQEAKLRGPHSARAWDPGLTSSVGRRLALLDELRRALEENEFVLHYQPILNLADQRVVGAEALLRWNHPTEGIVPPADFLPLLEESGLIVQVGCWVIREVVRQMQVWQMLYGRDMLDWVSINVSARQFNDPSLLLATLCEINDSGFPLDRLKLEITESAVMRSPELTSNVLGELQDIGIRVALDDFGTGYSALGALRHYSVDTIKIDRDFTKRLDTDDGRELVLALLKIARIYGAAVVAEGVETAAQQEILQQAGCDYGQGYLFAKPMGGSLFGAYALTHLVEGVVLEEAAAD